jgi:hypothetical protein
MSLQIENINYIPFHIKDWTGLHKELSSKYHIPNNVTGGVGTSVYDWTYENFGNFHSELTLLLSRFNIKVRRARFFYTAPESQLNVHIDGTNQLGHNYWAINFPIDVPLTEHYQEWYEYKGEYKSNYNSSYTDSTLLENPKDINLIDRLVLNRPYLVKVGIPHAVHNHSSSPRLILSIRFEAWAVNLMNLINYSIEQETALGYAHKIL